MYLLLKSAHALISRIYDIASPVLAAIWPVVKPVLLQLWGHLCELWAYCKPYVDQVVTWVVNILSMLAAFLWQKILEIDPVTAASCVVLLLTAVGLWAFSKWLKRAGYL